MYERINEILADIFLDRQNQGKRLYLVLGDQGRAKLAELMKCPPDRAEGYACGIVGGSFAKIGNPYTPHNERLSAWDRRQGSRPPFLALLYALAHAAELMVSDGNVSSTNYYQRLSELTRTDKTRLSHYGLETKKYWTAFSNWLTREDYVYGLPTAQSIGSNAYVGFALSQAVIRAADRQSFHQMFERYGFSGTDQLSTDEIGQYIAAWLPTGRASSHLKSAWASEELKPKICEVALAELEDWAVGDNENRFDGSPTPKRLSLAVSVISRIPSRFLQISVGKEEVLEQELALCSASEPSQRFSIGNTNYGSLATVGVADGLNTAHLLTRGIDLKAVPRGAEYYWKPRFIIPLKRSDVGPYWAEVTRVGIGVEHLVLVRSEQRFRIDVEALLSSCAMPGYTVTATEQLAGLPQGWLLYEKVRIIRAAESAREDLVPLVPISTVGTIEFRGGLKLGRNIWHKHASLDLRVIGEANVNIQAFDATDARQTPFGLLERSQDSASLKISKDLWPNSGSVVVRAIWPPQQTRTLNILLRSAEAPLPLDRAARDQLSYTGAANATSGNDRNPGVKGFNPIELPLRQNPNGLLKDFQLLEGAGEAEDLAPATAIPTSNDANQPQRSRHVIRSVVPEVLLPCVERGCHRWQLPSFDTQTSQREQVHAECKDCDVTVLMKRSGRREVRVANRPQILALPPVPAPAPNQNVSRRLQYNLLLDALCFLGSGSLAVLEGLVSERLQEPWRLHGLARDFSFLGHIDISLQSGTGRLHRWSVAPPVCAFIGPQSAVLSGYRSVAMILELKRQVENIGGRIIKLKLPNQPDLVALKGLTVDQVSDVSRHIRDPHGRPINVVANAAIRLAQNAFSLGNLFGGMIPVSVGHPAELKRYDVTNGTWMPRQTFDGPGAYRCQGFGITYVYKRTNGDLLQGQHEIVKLLAARSEKANLHKYEASTRTLISRLGCEPPGLIGRALVASSGRLPEIAGGMSVFNDVAPSVAATVLNVLYSEEAPT